MIPAQKPKAVILFEKYIEQYVPEFKQIISNRGVSFCADRDCSNCMFHQTCFRENNNLLFEEDMNYVRLKYPEYFI